MPLLAFSVLPRININCTTILQVYRTSAHVKCSAGLYYECMGLGIGMGPRVLVYYMGPCVLVYEPCVLVGGWVYVYMVVLNPKPFLFHSLHSAKRFVFITSFSVRSVLAPPLYYKASTVNPEVHVTSKHPHLQTLPLSPILQSGILACGYSVEVNVDTEASLLVGMEQVCSVL